MTAPGDYFKGLDSIRAISMALVLFVHLHLIGIGWVTIQVFFVMSGFLITRILLSMRERHGLKDYLLLFYARRTLRIFPVFYLTLAILFVASLVVAMPGFSEQAPYAALYVWNWFAILQEGPLVHYLEHFWSLAVEEQFYFAWPLLVFFARGQRFWKICAGIVAVGPLLRLGSVLLWDGLGHDPSAAPKALYQMSTTHLDAFATGALCCWAINQRWSRQFQPWHLGGLILAACALGMLVNGPGIGRGGEYHLPLNLGYPIHMGTSWQFVWGYTVLNLLSAGLLILVGQGRFLNSLFQHPLLARLGVITYGAYVIHVPLLHLANPAVQSVQAALGNYWGAAACAPVLLAITFALAELSYRYFESRFLRMKDRHFRVGGQPTPVTIDAGARAS